MSAMALLSSDGCPYRRFSHSLPFVTVILDRYALGPFADNGGRAAASVWKRASPIAGEHHAGTHLTLRQVKGIEKLFTR